MIVAVSEPELEYTGRFDWINDEGEGWDLSNDTLKLSTVKFNIKASPDSAYHVALKRYSFGRSEEEAMSRAEKIQYAAYSRDSVLDLGSGYSIGKDSKFRGQQVEIEIMVPVGKKIRFDESVNDKLNPANIKVKRNNRRNRVVDIEMENDYWHRFRSGIDYVMGIDGSLKAVSGSVIKSNDYRYDENDSIRIKKEIEIKKQELKELEELKKINRISSGASGTGDEENETDISFASSTLPAFSLISSYF